MHTYQQRHLNADQTWFRCSQGNRLWPTMGICKIQHYIMYDCPSCRKLFPNKPRNIICGIIATPSHKNKDWRNSLLEYLTYGYLKGPHISKGQHKRITQQNREYFIEERKMKIIFSNEDIKICIPGFEVNKYLQDFHITKTGKNLSLELTWHLLMFGP